MDEELFYVGIPDATGVRKELLTSSKNLLDSLKKYDLYQRVKMDKVRVIADLKRVFDELLLLNKKLRSKMPKVPVKVPDVGLPGREEPPSRELRTRELSKPVSKSKLDILEEELAKIESRLGSLD